MLRSAYRGLLIGGKMSHFWDIFELIVLSHCKTLSLNTQDFACLKTLLVFAFPLPGWVWEFL